MAISLLYGRPLTRPTFFDARQRKIPLIFIDLRGRKCTEISPVLPAEFSLENAAETLESPQLARGAGTCGLGTLKKIHA